MILVYLILTLSSYTCHIAKLETAREIYFEEQTHNRPNDFSTALLYRFSICNTDNMINNLYKILQTNLNASIGYYFEPTLQNLLSTRQNLIKDFKNGNRNPSSRFLVMRVFFVECLDSYFFELFDTIGIESLLHLDADLEASDNFADLTGPLSSGRSIDKSRFECGKKYLPIVYSRFHLLVGVYISN